MEKARGTLTQNQTYCKKEGDWSEWGEPTGKGKRSDVLALRDSVLSGKDDLQLAMDDSTCRASAQFARFTDNLRNRQREKVAKEVLAKSFEDKPLKPWQKTAVASIDAYASPSLGVHLETYLRIKKEKWSGLSYLEEFDYFKIHSFP